MKTQATVQNKPTKKLALKRESIRVLALSQELSTSGWICNRTSREC